MATRLERKRFATDLTTKGLLTKRSADGPPAPAASGRRFSVTRPTVGAALAIAVGATALALLSIRDGDPAGAVLAVYVGVTALALAPLVVADLRPAAALAIRPAEPAAQAGLTLVTARAGEEMTVDVGDDLLLIDAGAGDLRVELPAPSTFGDRVLRFERIDATDHRVVLDPLGRALRRADREVRLRVVDGAWTALA